MKKLEYILYSISLVVTLIVILARSFLWPWAGTFLILTYTSLALLFIVLSWLIYTIRDEQQKRIFFVYGSIPFGLAMASLILAMISKLQNWDWEAGAFKMAVFLFIIAEIAFLTAYFLIDIIIKRQFIRYMMLKILIFITLTVAVAYADFDKLIRTISTTEANRQRDEWEKQ